MLPCNCFPIEVPWISAVTHKPLCWSFTSGNPMKQWSETGLWTGWKLSRSSRNSLCTPSLVRFAVTKCSCTAGQLIRCYQDCFGEVVTYKFLFSVAVGKNFLLTRPPSRILEMSSSDFYPAKRGFVVGALGCPCGKHLGKSVVCA